MQCWCNDLPQVVSMIALKEFAVIKVDTKMFGIVQWFTCLYLFFPIWLKMWLIVRVPQFWHVLNQNMDIKIEDLSWLCDPQAGSAPRARTAAASTCCPASACPAPPPAPSRSSFSGAAANSGAAASAHPRQETRLSALSHGRSSPQILLEAGTMFRILWTHWKIPYTTHPVHGTSLYHLY